MGEGTQQAVKSEDGVFKALVDSVKDYAIYMVGRDGTVLTWNSGAERLKGYQATEIVGQNYAQFFLPDDVSAGKPKAELMNAAEFGRHEEEGWRLRKDGSRFWAGIVMTAIHGEQGELVGFAKVTRDLTERQRVEAWLQQGVEAAPTAMLMVDSTGGIVAVNTETERLFGYERRELLGQPIEMLMPSQYREGHPSLRQHYQERPKVHKMARGRDLHALHKSGSQFPVEISLNPVETDKGTFVLGSIVDLTERKAHEAFIRAALQEKDVLLREVYHRVKNNLQVIQSLLSLRSRTLPEGLARSVMMESVQRVRAMALVHEKLYQSDNLEKISLPDYISGLFRQLMDAYGRQGQVTLKQNIAAVNMGLERAVPMGLLLTELISNCLKHAFVDGRVGEVVVSLKETETGLRLVVADNGVGFAMDHDLQNSKSMGLTLVTSLAQQLNGTLNWGAGPGVEFALDLPSV